MEMASQQVAAGEGFNVQGCLFLEGGTSQGLLSEPLWVLEQDTPDTPDPFSKWPGWGLARLAVHCVYAP